MEEKIASSLVVYGPLGVICLVLLWVTYRLYKDLATVRDQHTQMLTLEREKHAKEMREMEERYITKAETWAEKYHELAKSMNQVLGAIGKRYERR